MAKQRSGSRTARHNCYLSPTQKVQILSKVSKCNSLVEFCWLNIYNTLRSKIPNVYTLPNVITKYAYYQMLICTFLFWGNFCDKFGVTISSLQRHWHEINEIYRVWTFLHCLRSRLLQKVVLPRRLRWEIVFVSTTVSPLVRREAQEYPVVEML